jgi:SPP1 family predicted phage head-tail adaptor
MVAPIGKLRHHARVQMRAETRAADGELVGSYWATTQPAWCNIRPAGGGEQETADQMQGTVTHRIEMRYNASIQPEQRVQHGSEIYAILAVTHERRNCRTVLLCEREMPTLADGWSA